MASIAPLNTKGRQALLLLPASGCVTQELPSEGQERFTAQGRWEATRTGRTCALDTFCPVPRRTSILLGTQRTEQEEQAWRWEQLS